ncbi:MAG TPA: trypsin-like peptidase domain-containing protein [Holophagaceae bacterium]|nr:trypsin-like peptidase domain-containing protein [Holophagaceae bacterium]
MIRSLLLALCPLLPLAAQGGPAPKAVGKPDLQAQEDAIIALYRKGAKPRVPAPRGRLLPEERNTIRRFKEAKGSIVYISTLQVGINRYTGDVMRVPAGTGTGWVWDDKGHVVTNKHVVSVGKGGLLDQVDEVRVTLADGHTYQARIIGSSVAYDTAVLQVFAPLDDLKPLPIGTSRDLVVGQSVIAIGNPWGLDHTLSTGVISALNRTLATEFNTELTGVIQTDAAINPGNSGGPLLDSSGRVIGMNAYIPPATGASVGIGFAIPIDTLNRVVPKLIRQGGLYRAQLGFEVISDQAAQTIGVTQGLVVQVVQPGSPAARAGMIPADIDRANGVVKRIGDVVVAIDGHEVRSVDDLAAYLEQNEPHDQVVLEVVRQGQLVKLTLDLRDPGKI